MLKTGVVPHVPPRNRSNVPDLLQELRQLLVLHLQGEALFTVSVTKTSQLREDGEKFCKHHIFSRPPVVHIGLQCLHVNFLNLFYPFGFF